MLILQQSAIDDGRIEAEIAARIRVFDVDGTAVVDEEGNGGKVALKTGKVPLLTAAAGVVVAVVPANLLPVVDQVRVEVVDRTITRPRGREVDACLGGDEEGGDAEEGEEEGLELHFGGFGAWR